MSARIVRGGGRFANTRESTACPLMFYFPDEAEAGKLHSTLSAFLTLTSLDNQGSVESGIFPLWVC